MSICLVIAGCVVCCFVITLTAKYIADPIISYIENGLTEKVWLHVKWPAYYLFFSAEILFFSCLVYEGRKKSLVLAGGIFQAIGTLNAACSIYATATKIFDKNPIREWCQRFPRIKQKFLPCPPCMAIQRSGGIACPRLYIFEDNKNSSIDDRLSIISSNQKMTKETVDYLCERVEKYRFLEDLEERIDEKIQNKNLEVKRDFESKLEKLHLSDFFPTIIGLLWIAIGVILATIGSL